jgi:hypothetical protein
VILKKYNFFSFKQINNMKDKELFNHRQKNSLLYEAVIFDLDGVVTDIAKVHASSWKVTLDGYLESR